MSNLSVVGSVAYDTVSTPFGKLERGKGGSAVYFSASASHFCPVEMIGVVGEDYELDFLERLKERGIGSQGVEIRKGEKTFYWAGRYEGNMNEAITEVTELNSFETFEPKLLDIHKKSPYLFLANIDPDLQNNVLEQMEEKGIVICDTMNFWIEIKKDSLLELFKKVTGVILNEGELQMLYPGQTYLEAVKSLLSIGMKIIIVKKGCYGVDAFTKDYMINLPAFLTENVKDPTGAGDTFGGGFMGYLASQNAGLEHKDIVKALEYGTIMASYNIEDFSMNNLLNIKKEDIEARIKLFRQRRGCK